MKYKAPPFGGIVCLRCQLRLLHSAAPRRPSFFHPPRALLRQPYRNSYASLTRSRAWKDRVIGPGPRRLHSEASVGGEGEALQPDLEPEHQKPELDDATKSDVEEIWNALLNDDGEPTPDQVFSNIDELQPENETTLTRSEFQRLADTLADGFTAVQLHEYVKANRKPAIRPATYPWQVQQLPWVPEGSAAGEGQGSSRGTTTTTSKASKTGKQSTGSARAAKAASGLLLRGYVSTSMTRKEKLAVQLVRECWGLSMLELMDAPGQLDVTVRELEYALLAAGAQTWLRDISTAFSTVTTTTAATNRSRSRSHSRGQTRQQRHIELDPELRLLRISAPATTADAMMAAIDKMLSQVTTRSFSLAEVAGQRGVIDEDALRAVGTMTESWVRLDDADADADADPDTDATNQQILVSWVAPADQDSHLRNAENAENDENAKNAENTENTGDKVYRLLLAAYGPTALPQTIELDYEPLKRTKARLISEFGSYTSRDAWSWEHRQGSWARLAEPCLSDAVAARTRLPVKVPGAQSLLFEFVSPVSTDADADADADGNENNSLSWYRLIRTSTVATFGRVLHAQPATGTVSSILSEPDDLAAVAAALEGQPRILSPVAPPLLGINLSAHEPAESAAPSSETPIATASTTVLLRFLPKPGTGLAHCAPPVEVYLDVPDLPASAAATAAGQPVLTALHTVMATHTSDVLFPTQPVDVRITQKRFFALPGADIATEAAMDPLRTFLDQTQLGRLGRQDRRASLSMPALLPGLGLPARVLLPVGEGAKLREQPRRRHEITAVDYLFAGLEVRRRVATAFEGWTLALTSVDAGRGGGRYTALTLEAAAAPAGMTGAAAGMDVATGGDLSKAAFRHAVGRLVHGDAIKWLMPGRELA